MTCPQGGDQDGEAPLAGSASQGYAVLLTNPSGVIGRRPRDTLVLIGILVSSLAVWIALFCAGATIETELARLSLAPLDGLSKQRDDDACRRLAALAGLEIEKAGTDGGRTTAGGPSTNEARSNAVGNAARHPVMVARLVSAAAESPDAKPGSEPEASDSRSLRERLAAWAGRQTTRKTAAFVTCLTCYSPINIALLSVMAGLIGGCTSNLYCSGAQAPKISAAEESAVSPQDLARADSLNENPAISAVRGLVGYILILAGVYAVFDDPFKNPTTSQYAKLAGFSSALAFTLGYDGTRFTRVLELFTTKQQKA